MKRVLYKMKAHEFPTEHFDMETQVRTIARKVERIMLEVVPEVT
jgi:hypothetical protein